MYIGIEYNTKLKEVNSQLKSLGSALIFSGRQNFYFTNVFTALAVKQYLSRKNKKNSYSLVQLSKDDIKNMTKINTYEEFIETTKPKNIPKNLDVHAELDKENELNI